MVQIILATQSKYRIEGFKETGLSFVSKASNIDEYFKERPKDPKELVLHLAEKKAKEIEKNYSSGIIIGFDSVAYFDGEILEKPKSKTDCFKRLKKLSGKDHEFYTGIYMKNIDSSKELKKIVETKIKLRDLKNSEIEMYLNQDSEYNKKALGYDPLKYYSSTFVKEITGSYTNIIRGVPLETIIEMLHEIGYNLTLTVLP